MIGVWSERFSRIEFVLICVLALVLPILEAPKNLAVLLLLLTWIAHRIVARDITPRRPDLIEASLLFILAACILSTVFNWPLVNGLKGLKDTMVQVVVFWFIYRAGYSERQRLILLAMVVAGALIGLAWGAGDILFGQARQLQFHSAGIVTQSAIYLGITLMAVLAVAVSRPSELSGLYQVRWPALWWSVAALFLFALFLMGSRGAILAVLVACMLVVFIYGRRAWVWASLGVAVLAAAFTLLLPDYLSQSRWLGKSLETVQTGHLVAADQERLDNWRIAISRVGQGDALLLGIGPRNFATIDYSRMTFDPPLVIKSGRLNHAHNLFLTKLVEEGIAGLAAMLFFFAIVVSRLLHARRKDGQWQWHGLAALGALTVPIIAGSFNTPWYQEHAMLAMMILAVAVAQTARATPADA